VKRESVFMGFNKGERARGKYINLEMRLMREKSERERERERESKRRRGEDQVALGL
jgi:hypothetical protein